MKIQGHFSVVGISIVFNAFERNIKLFNLLQIHLSLKLLAQVFIFPGGKLHNHIMMTTAFFKFPFSSVVYV